MINGLKLNNFGIVIASISIEDKERSPCFYKQIFLFANISIDIALKMSCCILSNIEINFARRYMY